VGDEYGFGCDLEEVGDCFNGLAAAVHEGCGEQEVEVGAQPVGLAVMALELAFFAQWLSGFPGKHFQEPEPGIVPGSGILRARVAQSHNEFERFCLHSGHRGEGSVLVAFLFFAFFTFFATTPGRPSCPWACG